MKKIEPYLIDGELEIEQYLTELSNSGRINEVPEHLSRVAADWKERFVERAKELGWAG